MLVVVLPFLAVGEGGGVWGEDGAQVGVGRADSKISICATRVWAVTRSDSNTLYIFEYSDT